ncbi:antibiotic biosynthesis monooxygenase [delta proteobacterium NaphS2]|nr:antibiotic biosynthesis monooxygenase [delta proteobacterium NaphS2]
MVTIIVKMKVRPEKHKELFQTVFSIAQHVRKENGCLNLGFYLNAENENDFLMVEEWASQKDWDDHQQSDIFTVLRGAGSLMRRPPEILVHTVSRPTELEHWSPKSNGRE